MRPMQSRQISAELAPYGSPNSEAETNRDSVEPKSLMVDKFTTVPKARLGKRTGSLDHEDIAAFEPSHHGIPGSRGASPEN